MLLDQTNHSPIDSTDNPVPDSLPISSDTAKSWIVSTVAGSIEAGFTDGDTTHARFRYPHAVYANNQGNLFVADEGNFAIREISSNGHVSTYASRDIGNIDPVFGNIYSLLGDATGNLYTIDYSYIRKIMSPTSNIKFAGELELGFRDGSGTQGRFNQPASMTIDRNGNIFLPDFDNDLHLRIRKVTAAGVVSTLTLHDTTGYNADASPNHYFLSAIAVDSLGIIYFSDLQNALIKKIDLNGEVTVFASLGGISSMACDRYGNIMVCSGNSILKVTPGAEISLVAGNGVSGYADGEGGQAQFSYPSGITVDSSGIVYVADAGNNMIRKIEFK